MQKTIAALEIGSSSARFAVGYVLKGRPHLIYYAEKDVSGYLSCGEIKDPSSLSSLLSSFSSVGDEAMRLKIDTDELSVALPPLGLEIYQNNKTTNVIGEEVDQLAINNALTLVRKDHIPSGNDIVDIVPDCFILENGHVYRNPPYGERSNTLTLQSKVHTVPSLLIKEYSEAVQNAGFRARRHCLAPYCASELVALDDSMPHSYFLVDMGAELTTVSLIGEKSLYCSYTIRHGGEDLSLALSKDLNIPLEEAEEAKRRYGYDDRKRAYAPILGKDGKELKGVKKEDVALSIGRFMEGYCKLLGNALDTASRKEGGDSRFQSLPFVLIGGASRLYGLEGIVGNAFPARKIIRFVPKTMGARAPEATNVLGLLLVSGEYRGSMEDNHRGVATLTRG